MIQVKSEGSVSMVAAVAALASLKNVNFVKDTRVNTGQARNLGNEAFTLLSLDYIPGNTNFILFNTDPIKTNFIQEMEAKKIYHKPGIIVIENSAGLAWPLMKNATVL